MMQTMTAEQNPQEGNLSDIDYEDYLRMLNAKVTALIDSGHQLFHTTASPEALWDAYLSGFPEGPIRQYHNCSCCRHFIQRFGGMVVIDDTGSARSALWVSKSGTMEFMDAPGKYLDSMKAMLKLIHGAKVTGPMVTSDALLGTAKTGEWKHFHLRLPGQCLFPKNKANTADQQAAEKKEDFKNVSRALSQFPNPVLKQVVTLLESEALYRSEKLLGPMKWLSDLQNSIQGQHGPSKHNLIWKAVASAPAGFCHPRSSMGGTLLDDLADGMDFADVSRRFAAKMNPTVYQRPQAAPTDGNIKRGEELIAKLGLTKALERRFARFEEVPKLWVPKQQEATDPAFKGVFAHLKSKPSTDAPVVSVPALPISFVKFLRTVLPKAETLEIPFLTGRQQAFFALVTAVHADAPPIFQWDDPEARNPVSWFTYPGGTRPSQWGLQEGRFYPVSGIVQVPHKWGNKQFDQHTDGVVLTIDGCIDSNDSGSALFPECLIGDLREIRATIEAYSKSAPLQGREQASACGIGLTASSKGISQNIRATVQGVKFNYVIDRWE